MALRKPPTSTIDNLIKKAKKVEPKKLLEEHDRLTIQGHVHLEHLGSEPLNVPITFSRLTQTMHQPVVRRIVVPASYTPLPCEWIPANDVGMIVIENRAGKGMLVQPTKEEKELIARQVIEVTTAKDIPGWMIYPGMIFTAMPSQAGTVLMRALDTPVNINIYLIGR